MKTVGAILVATCLALSMWLLLRPTKPQPVLEPQSVSQPTQVSHPQETYSGHFTIRNTIFLMENKTSSD
jgi:hypothetical protein